MSNAQTSGGGFFFSPFSSTQCFGQYNPATDAIAFNYGPWAHLVAPVLTRRARWITMHIFPGAAIPVAFYYVQLGLGPLGGEVLWQPSDGIGLAPPPGSFVIDWFTPGALFTIPFVMSFPCTTPPGQEICVRCASSPAPAGQLNVNLYVFN